MPLKVVYTGDLPSLEVRLLDSLKADRRDNPLHPGVVLSSSHLLGTHLRRQAVRAGTCLFNVRFHTFDTLSADLLPLDYRKRKLISPLGELSLLRKIVRSYPGYFEPVQDKSGFWFALLATVRDLIDARIEEIPGRIQKTGKLKDIARILQSYRKEIAPFISRSRALELATKNIDRFAGVYGTGSLIVYGFYDFTRLQKEFLSAALEKLSVTAFLTYQSGDAYAFAEAALHFFQQLGFQHTPLHKQSLPAPESGSTCRDLQLLQSRIFRPAQKDSEKTAASKNQNPTPELRFVFQTAGRGRRKQFQNPAQGLLFDTMQRQSPAGASQMQTEEEQTRNPHSAIDNPQSAIRFQEPSAPAPAEVTHPTFEIRNSKFDTRHPTPDGTVTLISAADEAAEITEICREIQNCARKGLDFSEMAVLLRNPETYVPLVIDTFTANGVPYYLQSALPLSETHQAKSLLLFLELIGTDFPRSQVVELAAFAPLRWRSVFSQSSFDFSEFRISAAAWDRFSAQAGVGSGVANWIRRLSALSLEAQKKLSEASSGDSVADSRSPVHLQLQIFHIETLLEFVRTLDRWRKSFAESRTWTDFALLTREAMKLFLPSSGARSEPSAPAEESSLKDFVHPDEIWQQLENTVDSIATLDQVDPQSDLQAWISALRATLDNDRMSVERFEDGKVSVLSVMGARGTRHRVVFLPGMTERMFPLMARQDAILLDRERKEINQATSGGLPLKSLRPKEEQLLFQLCLSAAREKLVLSFPRIDTQTGRTRLASHYLVRTAEALTGSTHDYQTIEKLPHLKRISLSQLGPEKTAEALTENQFALVALRDGRRVPASLYNSRLRRSLEAYRCRWSRNFTPHDGFIHSPELLASISQWADQQFFSPSRLEIFATCPYRFFLLKLLRLEAVQDPETIQKISPLDKGGLVHKILDTFMRDVREKGWFPLAAQHAAWLHRLLDEVAQEAFREAEERGATGYQLLWELDSEQILADLHTFVQKEIERTDAVAPDRFEVDFGAAGSAPFQLTLPDGSCLSLTGRIDRIDIDPARSAVRVVDYKTGMYRLNEQAIFEGGRKLQLPLYLMAAAELYGLSSLEESVAEYYFVSSLGKFHVHPFTGENWEQKEKQLVQILQILTTAMRRGRFPARPGPGKQNCKWCDYRLVCDKAVDRIHSFKVHSPELEFLGLLEDYP